MQKQVREKIGQLEKAIMFTRNEWYTYQMYSNVGVWLLALPGYHGLPRFLHRILYIYTQYDIYQDPPMIHLFVYRFYFARAEDFRSFAKNCSFAENMLEGSFLPHCQLVLLQFLNLRFFALSWRIFAFFLRKFSLELVSHQSKQVLFSVELG